jgi:hydrogenase expression/formation protein HypE
MHALIEQHLLSDYQRAHLPLHDSAVLEFDGLRLAFSTDSYVVHPRSFPGGDIGMLAIYGTVNDLAMAGGAPRYLSSAFIVEEGFSLDELSSIIQSMQRAHVAGVELVTGDTKVVDRGKGDGLFVNTAGIAVIPSGLQIHPHEIRPGDVVLVSGDVGRHGIAVMACREGLEFETTIESDVAPLHELVRLLLDGGLPVHCLRDPTRGGLASTLNELATAAGVGIEIEENRVPVHEAVRGACELLGLDPLYVACEGRMVVVLPAEAEVRALEVLRHHPLGAYAARIGRVVSEMPAVVWLKTSLGARRVLDLLRGEQLPRIC